MKNKLIDQIATFVLIAALTFIGNSIISFFAVDKGTIRIGSVIETDNGKYQVCIDIYNFSSKSIENLKIKIPTNITVDNIKSNQLLNIEKVPNNIQNEDSSIFKISSIEEKQKVRVVFLLSNSIDYKNIVALKDGNKLKIEYPDDIKSPFEEDLRNVLLTSLLYTSILSALNYFSDKRNAKRIDEIKELYNQANTRLETEALDWEKKSESFSKKTDDMEKKITIYQEQHKKRELLLLAKLKDYKVELDFWRDTLRSMLYKSKNEKNDADVIIDIVTKTLKTYQTIRDDEVDLDTLKILSGLINGEKSS